MKKLFWVLEYFEGFREGRTFQKELNRRKLIKAIQTEITQHGTYDAYTDGLDTAIEIVRDLTK